MWGGGRVRRVDGAVVGTDMKKRPSLVEPFLSKTRGENRNRMVKGKIAVLFACGNVDATLSINAGRPHGAFLHMISRALSPLSSHEIAPSPHECQHTTKARTRCADPFSKTILRLVIDPSSIRRRLTECITVCVLEPLSERRLGECMCVAT